MNDGFEGTAREMDGRVQQTIGAHRPPGSSGDQWMRPRCCC
jgi:hypothetical protein